MKKLTSIFILIACSLFGQPEFISDFTGPQMMTILNKANNNYLSFYEDFGEAYIYKGGVGNVSIIPDRFSGNFDIGEFEIAGTTLDHPDGTLRTITGTTLITDLGEGTTGRYYIVFSDENPATRFATLSFGTSEDFFVMVSDGSGGWNATGNSGNTESVTLLSTDVVVAYGQAVATVGSRFFHSFINGTALEVNDLTGEVTWSDVPDANITSTSIVQHEGDLSLAIGQVSLLQETLDNKSEAADITTAIDNERGGLQEVAISSATDANNGHFGKVLKFDMSSGAYDFTIPSGLETEKSFEVMLSEASNTLTIAAGGGVTLLGTNTLSVIKPPIRVYHTSTLNTWEIVGNDAIPNSSISQSAVTQHQAAITVTESQISDLGNYLVVPGLNNQTGTTYTLVLSDAFEVVEMENASANILTVPPNSSVAFPTGTRITVVQASTGETSITEGAGVTVSGTTTIGSQWGYAEIYKRATDEWVSLVSTGTSATISEITSPAEGATISGASYAVNYTIASGVSSSEIYFIESQ